MRLKKIVATTILALLVSFACTKIQSQTKPQHNFEKAKDSKYTYGVYVRKLHEYEDIFSTHTESYIHFNKFNRNRIRAKRWGLISLGLTAITPILYSRILRDGYVDPDPAYLLAVLTTTPLAIITGSLGIALKLRSNVAKSKAITTFNNKSPRSTMQDAGLTPSIVFNGNRIGLALSF